MRDYLPCMSDQNGGPCVTTDINTESYSVGNVQSCSPHISQTFQRKLANSPFILCWKYWRWTPKVKPIPKVALGISSCRPAIVSSFILEQYSSFRLRSQNTKTIIFQPTCNKHHQLTPGFTTIKTNRSKTILFVWLFVSRTLWIRSIKSNSRALESYLPKKLITILPK